MTMSDKNSCVLVAGKLSIFSVRGITETTMTEIRDTLYYSMIDGTFVNTSIGIVRVSPSSSDIAVDEIDDPNAIDGDESSNNLEPSDGDRGSMLGIGLSISGAAFLIFALLASVYQRRKRIAEDNVSSLPEGLSRFDGNSHEQTSVGERSSPSKRSQTMEVIPLSPSVASTRYSTTDQNSRLSER